MRSPDEWLVEMMGDRPDDFAPGELEKARAFIVSVQRDAARPCPIRPLLFIVILLAIAVAVRLLVHR